jgi:hypothetical protein
MYSDLSDPSNLWATGEGHGRFVQEARDSFEMNP